MEVKATSSPKILLVICGLTLIACPFILNLMKGGPATASEQTAFNEQITNPHLAQQLSNDIQQPATSTLASHWEHSLKLILEFRGPSLVLILELNQYLAIFEELNPMGRNLHYSTQKYPNAPDSIRFIADREIYTQRDCPQRGRCPGLIKACFSVMVVNYPTWKKHAWQFPNSAVDAFHTSGACSKSREINWLLLNTSCEAARVPPHEVGPYTSPNVCHRVTGQAENLPVNPLDWQGPPDFFLVWSGSKALNAMSMACLRSIFKHNPNSTVRIFSNSLDLNISDPFRARSYDLRIERFDLGALVKGSPAEEWYHSDALATCIFKRQNLSNILRLLLLYHFGGVYLDFDIIVNADLRYTKDSVGFQGSTLNGAVMSFERKHPFVWECMSDFVKHFNGDIWGNNGPMVVTRTFWKTKQVINVLGEWAYYPVPYRLTRAMFQRPVDDDSATLDIIRKHALVVHLWNNLAAAHHYAVANRSITSRLMKPYLVPYASSGRPTVAITSPPLALR